MPNPEWENHCGPDTTIRSYIFDKIKRAIQLQIVVLETELEIQPMLVDNDVLIERIKMRAKIEALRWTLDEINNG
jgi:hypothetical protein